MTCIGTGEGWLYLAAVMDLFSRKIVGWAMSETMPRELTLAALHMAITNRRPSQGLHHHPDRGSQYAAHAYRRVLDAIASSDGSNAVSTRTGGHGASATGLLPG